MALLAKRDITERELSQRCSRLEPLRRLLHGACRIGVSRRPSVSAVHRESKESPRLKAFCRVAPSVLFNDRAIFPAGVFFRASAFNVRKCSDVQARRFPFRFVMISPSGQSAAL